MKFLLKKRYGYLSKFYFCFNTSIILSLTFTGIIFLFGSNVELSFTNFLQYTFILFLGCLFIFWVANVLIEQYRARIPYKIENITENNKNYIVKYFPIEHCRKFIYEGKLHRENGAAVEYVNENGMGSKFLNQYYWNGKQINQKDFHLYIKQEKINQF